jgi:hypothetical protein
MNGELVPGQRDMLMSDADRERLMARLQSAVSEGRLTLPEFQDRVDGVLQARRFRDAEPFLVGLPFQAAAAAQVELRTVASSLLRKGAWLVPRRILVFSKAGSVKLDFTEAVIAGPIVEVVLDVTAASCVLVVPPGSTVDVDGVEMMAGSVHVRKIERSSEPHSGVHFVVTGRQRAGSLTVRPARTFFKKSW